MEHKCTEKFETFSRSRTKKVLNQVKQCTTMRNPCADCYVVISITGCHTEKTCSCINYQTEVSPYKWISDKYMYINMVVPLLHLTGDGMV